MKHTFSILVTIHILIASACHGMQNSIQHIKEIKKLTPTIHSYHQTHTPELLVKTLYRDFKITEPVLIDLFNSPIMERIKHVRQYGVLDYIIKQKREYTRYEHCVGVWALLRIHGACLEEQIAGLLHDASHTVFSHVGDILFNHHSTDSSYQDDIHEWYLKQMHADALLAKHGISLNAILHKSGTHTMLEQDLPDICADRLEYNLQAGILTDMLTTDDIAHLLKNIRYDNGKWFFTNKECAKKLGHVSLFNTKNVWSSPANQFIYRWTARALTRALKIKLLTADDIHFSTDPVVWDKLYISNDSYIAKCLNMIINYNSPTMIDTYKQEPVKGKFRGLDPWVQEDNNTLKRLTTIDEQYRIEYNRLKAHMTHTSKL